MLSLVIGQSGCPPHETAGRAKVEVRRSGFSELQTPKVEIRIAPIARARPAFPALLATLSGDAILANDHQAHNATAVSGAGAWLIHNRVAPCDND